MINIIIKVEIKIFVFQVTLRRATEQVNKSKYVTEQQVHKVVYLLALGVQEQETDPEHCQFVTRAVEAGLVERSFIYDVMLHATFTRGCVQPGGAWTADPLTRYANTVTKGTLTAYQDPKSKRAHKGKAAIPPRYLQLTGKPLGISGKHSASDALSA